MNKVVRLLIVGAVGVAVLAGCNGKDPRRQGEKAGEASCECYRLGTAEEVNKCLDEISREYSEYLTDTAFINAVATKMLHCISDGVADLDKPLIESEEVADTMVQELDTLTVDCETITE